VGRELLKMSLDDIYNVVKAFHRAEGDRQLQLEIKNEMTSEDLENPDDRDAGGA
jgi:hypothetical protein